MAFDPGDDILEPLLRDHARVDCLPTGRKLIQPAHIHLAILRESEAARDRGRRHSQRVRRALAFGSECKALLDAKAVLLVNHDKAEILIGHAVLKNRVGADEDIDISVDETHQQSLTLASLGTSRQERDLDPSRRGHLAQGFEMLAREDFGRSEQCGLLARFVGDQHRLERHNGLARANVTLQQSQHRRFLLHVAFNLRHRAFLRAGHFEGQLQLVAQRSVALERLTLSAATVGAHQKQREAVGQQFVIGKPITGTLIHVLMRKV